MEFEKSHIQGVILLKPKVFGDERGYFVETWQDKRYQELGITQNFVQDNHSRSSYGILRGLHFQKNYPQGKLVHVSYGSVLDVVVDIRPDSPSFAQHYAVELTAQNQHQLWIPPGLAHGFIVTSEICNFHYKCTEYYHPEDEYSLLWNDVKLKIDWKIAEPKLSSKDANAPSWKELFEQELFANIKN